MDLAKDQGLVIKMAQKNKETQTIKMGGCGPMPGRFLGSPFQATRYGSFDPSPSEYKLYMDREEDLYRRACRLKGISVQRDKSDKEDDDHEEEEDSLTSEEEVHGARVRYRYTLDEMKSYNPYRFFQF